MYAGIVAGQTTDGTRVPFTKAGRARPRVPLAKSAKRRAPHDYSDVDSNYKLRQKVNLTGRPTVMINVGGKKVVGFIDTGSAVSLINSSSLNWFKFASRARKARSLVGVTGTLLETIEERDVEVKISPSLKVIHRFTITSACPFPGDVLLGIDFLRRFKFSLDHKPFPSKCGLRINEEYLPVTFTDKPSLGIALAEVKSPVHTVDLKGLFGPPPVSYARIKRATVIPSQTGKFVPVTISRISHSDCDYNCARLSQRDGYPESDCQI